VRWSPNERFENHHRKAFGLLRRVSSGLQGAVVGQDDTYEEAVEDVKSAIAFHTGTFGRSVWETGEVVLEAFVAEARIPA